MNHNCQRHRMERRRTAGVALVIVLWVMLLLSLLISGFAFTMHVETQVASHARKRTQAGALARSGVELVRRELIFDMLSSTNSTTDIRTQPWATNPSWYVNHSLGNGVINVVVTDAESKIPLNRATPDQLRRLLALLEVDVGDADIIVDSILDWIDENDLHRLNGAEDDYYRSLEPPYRAKNGPFDRMEELLLVRGVTPDYLFGRPAGDLDDARPGLADYLTIQSSGRVNINTAAAPVLQALLGLDDRQTEALESRRRGDDGEWGTEDDVGFLSVNEFFAAIGNLPAEVQNELQQVLTVQSEYFTVQATGTVGEVNETVVALLQRNGAEITIISWRAKPATAAPTT